MTEHDWLAGAPVFIVDLNSVFGCDVAHIFSFLCISPAILFKSAKTLIETLTSPASGENREEILSKSQTVLLDEGTDLTREGRALHGN